MSEHGETEPYGTSATCRPKEETSESENVVQRFQLFSTQAMPGPKDRRAPHFRGKHVFDFVNTLEHLASACGLARDSLPGYVLRYCSHEVRNVLVNEAVFKSDDWKATRERLIYLYESQTSQFKASVRKLRKFVKKEMKRKRVRNRRTLDDYRNKFVRQLGNLVAKKELAENEANIMFFQGLPQKLRDAILPALREEAKAQGESVSKSNPPTIESVWSAARDYYSSDDINRLDSEESDDDSDSSSSSSSGSDSDGTSDSESEGADLFRDKKKKKKYSKKKKGRGNTDDSSDEDDSDNKKKRKGKQKNKKMDDIASKVEERLTRRMDDLATRLLKDRQPVSTTVNPPITTVYTNPPSQPGQSSFTAAGNAQAWSQDRRCFICGKAEGQGLDHRFGVKMCPETERLVRDGLLKYSPVDGRMLRADGRDLPRLQTLPNGLATFLRAEAQVQSQQATGSWASRDPPPHQSAATIRECNSIGLYRNNEPVVHAAEYSHYASSGTCTSMPAVTRSKGKEVERTARIEEVEEEDGDVRKVKKTTTVQEPVVPPKMGATRHVLHESNTEDAWKAAQKARYKTTVEDEKEGARSNAKAPQVRFTSDLQESVNMEVIQDQILNTKLTISLREVLAMSPHLQKRLGSLVKTRREGDTRGVKAGEVCEIECVDAAVRNAIVEHERSVALVTYDRTTENLDSLLERYADVVGIGRSRLFAMASGLIEVVFGDQRGTFLVDTGSELNLVSRRIWDKTSLKVDTDGSRWSLKGLGGEDVPLLGCCRDAPLQVGGKNFDHHFFVCAVDRSRYDGILGQPWFEWFSAQIEYSREGVVMLQVYTSGDREGAFARVPIVKAEHPRNQDRLVMTSQVEGVPAFQ